MAVGRTGTLSNNSGIVIAHAHKLSAVIRWALDGNRRATYVKKLRSKLYLEQM